MDWHQLIAWFKLILFVLFFMLIAVGIMAVIALLYNCIQKYFGDGPAVVFFLLVFALALYDHFKKKSK